MEEKRPHRGIDMHRLPVAGDLPGLVFAVGTAVIFLIAIPALGYALIGAVALGLIIAAVLQLVERRGQDQVRQRRTLGRLREY
jgi:uncharacterized protein (DUF2062 family)